jgi:hypothetical protein
MRIIETQSGPGFQDYQDTFHNTICGRHPIAVRTHSLTHSLTRMCVYIFMSHASFSVSAHRCTRVCECTYVCLCIYVDAGAPRHAGCERSQARSAIRTLRTEQQSYAENRFERKLRSRSCHSGAGITAVLLLQPTHTRQPSETSSFTYSLYKYNRL